MNELSDRQYLSRQYLLVQRQLLFYGCFTGNTSAELSSLYQLSPSRKCSDLSDPFLGMLLTALKRVQLFLPPPESVSFQSSASWHLPPIASYSLTLLAFQYIAMGSRNKKAKHNVSLWSLQQIGDWLLQARSPALHLHLLR